MLHTFHKSFQFLHEHCWKREMIPLTNQLAMDYFLLAQHFQCFFEILIKDEFSFRRKISMIWNKYPWLNLFHKEVFSGATSSSRCRINPVYHYSFPNWNYSILQMRIIPELDSFEIRLMPTASEVCIKLPSSESSPHRTVGFFFKYNPTQLERYSTTSWTTSLSVWQI